LVTAFAAWIAGLMFIAAVLYFSNGGADFSVTDIAGFGGIVIIVSADTYAGLVFANAL
jgi:hypothetical protein